MPKGNPMQIVNSFGQDTSLNIDAFGRLRVSHPYTLLDNKNLFGNLDQLWDEQQVSGSGTSSQFNANNASITLSVSANQVGRRIRQTKIRPLYQPGKSQLVLFTCKLGETPSSVSKKVGYFDDKNGLFFECVNNVVYVVKRSYATGVAVDTKIPQSEWNIDKLDGSGVSRFTYNHHHANIYFINFEWLGVGEVFFGIVSNGIYHLCHVFHHSNQVDHVYMSSPNLPLRAEIDKTVGNEDASELTVICSTVMSEGGKDPSGIISSYDRGNVAFACPNNNSLYPIVCVKIKNDYVGVQAIPIELSVVSVAITPYRWALILNPTFVGTLPTYTDNPHGFLASCQNTTSATTITGGIVLYSGYTDKSSGATMISDLPPTFGLGHTINNVSDVLVLAICSITSKADEFYGSITMKEIM
jgi:hypothetical protein